MDSRSRPPTPLALFEKDGNRYGFDPLMLAAQGYKESQLNQQARSHALFAFASYNCGPGNVSRARKEAAS